MMTPEQILYRKKILIRKEEMENAGLKETAAYRGLLRVIEKEQLKNGD